MQLSRINDKAKIFVNKIQRLPKDKFWERALLGIKKEFSNYPKFITLQTVSACNLQCKHCFINDYKIEIEDGVIKIMKYEEFLKFSDRLKTIIKHADFFTFSSFEALLNKNLFKMMDHLLTMNPSLQFPLLSNAMLLSDETIAQLEKYPVPEINISLDGMTKEVVENFKTGVDFEAITAALKKLKKSAVRDRVAVTFVAHQDNIHQLPDYVDFVHALGVKLIYVSNILTFTEKTAHLALYTKQGNVTAQQLFDEAVTRARKNRQTIQLPQLQPSLKGCQAVEAFFVDSNGNVAPCDFLAVSTPFTLFETTQRNPPQIFGNVLFDDPVEIYRSERYQNFRNAHRLAKELPEACKNCIDAYGLMCSNRTVYN
ncbi:MAG TPA: radical SAM/SPASM domain-containing protein [Flavisolibacter sp.]|nr:radical SAM/SPASM domain-containing protein [Flavisolibacter sp.]